MRLSLSNTMQVTIPPEITKLDILVLELSTYLIERLGNKVIRVERIAGWDGSNVRIVVRDLDCIGETLEAIENFERERGILGTIAPEVVTLEEYIIRSREEPLETLDDNIFGELENYLRKNLGNKVVRIERIAGWDGSNVRIVVRDLDCIGETLEAIENFERERGILGTIAPEVVLVDEV